MILFQQMNIKMRMRKVFFLVIVSMIGMNQLHAQSKVKIKANYNNMPFAEFCDSLYRSEGIRIYYKSKWVEEVIIHQPSDINSLNEILKLSLEPHKIAFYSDSNNRIYLSSSTKIKTELNEVFFMVERDTEKELAEIEVNKSEDEANIVNNVKSGVREIITIGNPVNSNLNKKAILSGYISEAETGEPVIGAVIYVEDLELGGITDATGYFVLSMKRGRHRISFQSLGKKNQTIDVVVNESGSLNIELIEEITKLRGVEVVAEKGKNVTGMQMGFNKVNIEMIKQIPAMMGENDILKTALLLPGVQTVGEGASGFNVRGGSTDQNLILLNKAPVFNSAHFFGFFSAFNPDVVKDFTLYKSGIPAEYGGRISSVFDISTKTGNARKVSGSGGISPVTAKLMLEGPTIKDKGSFVIGARSTYSDWLLKQFPNTNLHNSEASFSDMNLGLTHNFNSKNTLTLSGYLSKDRFKLNSDTSYSYNNYNGSLTWKHHFSSKLIGELSAIGSNYSYDISSDGNPLNAFSLQYRIMYLEQRADFKYFPSNDHSVKFGVSSVSYLLQPGDRRSVGEESLVTSMHLEREKAHDLSLYMSDEYKITSRLSLYGGLRYSLYRFLGPKSLYQFSDGPVELYNLVDTISYGSGTIQNYKGPELRFSLRYKIDNVSSLKLSYNRLRQYLHMLSNTSAISPTDTWKLSDPNIKPQIGDQIALGVYRDFNQNTIETSIEVYYKHIKDIIEYQSGASLLLNPHIETDLISGTGKAYGTELLIKKIRGRFNGWMSYTYSRTLIKVKGEVSEETINNGEYFPANYDKPHDFTLVANYKFSRRFSLSSTLTYSTGRPITYPVAKYSFRNSTLAHYSFRNEFRVPDYFRCDVSVNLDGNLRSQKMAHSFWALSVYNLTGRNNVYSIYFISSGGDVKGYKMSIFNRPIPTLTYTFKF